MTRSALALLSCLVAAACGSSHAGNDVPDASEEIDLTGLKSISVEPGTVTLVADGQAPAVQAYSAAGEFADGSVRDITKGVRWSIADNGLGGFEGASFVTSNRQGGRSTVRASGGGKTGTAFLTVQVRQRHLDPSIPGIPDDAGNKLMGTPNASRAPELIYPADGVLLPPNLRRLTIQFRPGNSNNLFAIDFASDVSDITVYTRCTPQVNGQAIAGCGYEPDRDVWNWIARSNRGDPRGVRVTVRGGDDGATGVGVSGSIQVGFSQDDIRGAIYYWSTSNGTAIERFDFATDQTAPQSFVDWTAVRTSPDQKPSSDNGPCVGCHALSRNGKRMVVAANASYNANVLLMDVGKRTALVPYNTTPRSAFSSWNPDGTQFVGVYGREDDGFLSHDLNLFDGATGEPVGKPIPVGGSLDKPVTHPDWSPDGTRIAFTQADSRKEPDNGSTARKIYATSLRMISREGDTWGPVVQLTPTIQGVSTYYPAFSPANDLLIFNRSSCGGTTNGDNCDCYDDPNAALFAMRPEKGAQPVELVRANTGGILENGARVQSSYPKWSPFTFQRTGEFGSRLHWVTFSSERSYGLFKPGLDEENNQKALIWMVAVDPGDALAGRDPSYPAFALPFQDFATDNHTAQWAERVVVID